MTEHGSNADDDRTTGTGGSRAETWCVTAVAATPKFKNPPVVETVLGVQFPQVEGFRATHFGLYYESLEGRFPTVTDQPRLEPARERFPRPLLLPAPQVQVFPRIKPDRVWFTADSGSELIQLQADRFLFNWRRQDNREYPSYGTNSEVFLKEFDLFREFCGKHKLPDPMPEVCEVTYVNHFDPEPNETATQLAARTFAGLGWCGTDGFLPIPESLTFNRAYVITSENKAIGRLYAEVSIAVRRAEAGEPKEFVLLNLTGRVNHVPSDGFDLRKTLQVAHDWVVCGFADVTERKIQDKEWERIE